MKLKLDKIHNRVVEAKPNQSRKKLILGLIASLLLFFGLAYYFLIHKATTPVPSPPGIYAQYFEPYPMSLASRGNDDTSLKLLQINKLYSSQKYQEALPIIEELLESTTDTKLYLAAGISASQIGQFELAYKNFNFLIDNKDSLYMSQASWYAAMTALKEDKQALAKKYLQSLVDSPNNFKKEESQKIIQLLK